MKTLIVNLGPIGDVIRTTFLLNTLEGEIYWITKRKCSDVLKSKKITKLFFVEEQIDELFEIVFDKIINLNEEPEALKIVKKIKSKNFSGVYLNDNGKVDYTFDSSEWFDMSLSSKLGKNKADELKWENNKSYQEMIIKMTNNKWEEQEYNLGYVAMQRPTKKIGIIREVKGIWPNKGWEYYEDLAKKLIGKGFEVIFLDMKPTFEAHINEINLCNIIVCGDTAGMHVALALKKKVIALFNCTSPQEIYGYGRMKKIISPLLKEYFYKKTDNIESRRAINLEDVYSVVIEQMRA